MVLVIDYRRDCLRQVADPFNEVRETCLQAAEAIGLSTHCDAMKGGWYNRSATILCLQYRRPLVSPCSLTMYMGLMHRISVHQGGTCSACIT